MVRFLRNGRPARVTPIPKSGKSEEISNYRPVSFLPVVGKLLEKLVYHTYTWKGTPY